MPISRMMPISGGATFTQNADFHLASFNQGASFVEATFTQGANFSDAIFAQNHTFESARFNQRALFDGVSYENEETTTKHGGTFNGCTFEGDVSFTNIATRSKISFHGITFHKRFTVGAIGGIPVRLEALELVDCTFERDANVHIGSLIIDKLEFSQLRNLSPLVKFVNIAVKQQFVLEDSTLSGAELSNVVLAKNDKKENWEAAIKIALSSFTKTAFNNVQWGKVERIDADRDTFRQLKAANEDQKNYLQANEFYMMEMKKYGKEIHGRKDKRQERVEFWLGDKLSKFSNDWVRPIVWLIGLTALFYAFTFCAELKTEANTLWLASQGHNGEFLVQLPPIVYCETNRFFTFMNPLETKYNDLNVPASIWVFYKVSAGLVIYQIIVSLRRKTRH